VHAWPAPCRLPVPTYPGSCLRAVSCEEENISPAQAVFSTPIVLPGQFLDATANEPEFFIKFSNELGAAESIATRHNRARA
jgi:hypothetical protein